MRNGLNPRQHQSGASVDRATRYISKIGNAVLRAAGTVHAFGPIRHAGIIQPSSRWRLG